MLIDLPFQFPCESERIFNLPGSAAALLLATLPEPFIAAEQDEESAARLHRDIVFLRLILNGGEDLKRTIRLLPEPNGPSTAGRRAAFVAGLRPGDSIVTSAAGFEAPVWPAEALKKQALSLRRGDEADREEIARRLRGLGYHKAAIVADSGEFCVKGWLLDLFPSSEEDPVRIEFFGDEIEEIKSFAIENQKSIASREEVVVLPAVESAEGVPVSSLTGARLFLVDVKPGVADDRPGTVLSRFAFQDGGADAGMLSIRGQGIFPDERSSFANLAEALRRLRKEHRILIVSSSHGQAERVREILYEEDVIVPLIDAAELWHYEGDMAITVGPLSSGLFFPGLLVLTERELFGERPVYRSLRRSRVSELLTAVDEIAPGDFVVHVDHGIGRFVSLEKQSDGGQETDLIVLEYVGGDRLYIPVYNIGRIKKYHAEEGVLPALDRLGGKAWQKTREKARKSAEEMADKLLTLYAEREVLHRPPFSAMTALHREFADFFPYEETPDQARAIGEIASDMEAERPMERLLCGDVGYGKTEVAMRAAFTAVFDGRQVAVLVPTTILCEQHYLTFSSRFSGFPVRIDYLSRFKSRKEQEATLRSLARGEVDIVIGTHSLLRKELAFANLGLLIVDEEHRFGVGQKERIKEISRGIDILAMTATPIPRTLQMALSGIRAMSLIETPPEERMAVRTIVSVFNEEVIREALDRELGRGGQVLFVRNIVQGIETSVDRMKRLAPRARIGLAHGQMAPRQLEEVMLRFFKRELDLLVSTNIIGAGLDMPTANTIIVDRADRMGLADLYQLKGRVGRSPVKAYAYFLIPGEDLLSDEAKKRIQAIRDMSFLGAGFRLAMKDLEIRGAGNLLGSQQSGHIHAVGMDLYMEMLEKAVADLKGVERKEEVDPAISLAVAAFIPSEYIEDVTIRLGMYRRVANAREEVALDEMKAEMRDRFGALPPEVKGLFEVMRLKLVARTLRVSSLSEGSGRARFTFAEDTPATPERILSLQQVFRSIRFHKNGFDLPLKQGSVDDRCGTLRDILGRLL